MSSFSDELAKLSGKKRELLLLLLEEQRKGQSPFAIRRQPRAAGSNVFPASFEQQRLWAAQQANPADASYNLCFAIRLLGRLDVAALRQSLDLLAQRHETLRTTFELRGGDVVQVIAPTPQIELAQLDLSAEAEREATVERLAGVAAQQPFDLGAGPLMRTSLLRLGDEEHVLLLTIHHIISDTWSMGRLLHEVQVFYTAVSSAAPIELPELPIQYADYAVWQRQSLQGEGLGRLLRYWREALAGLPELLALPTDTPRPPVQTLRGDTLTFTLSQELTAAIKALGQAEGVTLFVVLISAFQTLLAYLSGQNDLCVGTAMANRTQVETEGLIGYFANTLALRTTLNGAHSISELLCQVQQRLADAQAHQSLPFDRLVQELQPARNPQYHPLFQVAFVLQSGPRTLPGQSALRMLPQKVNTGHVPFDLLIHMTAVGDVLTGSIDYNIDLFRRQRIAHMAMLFERLLLYITEHPAATLQALQHELAELDAEERRKRQADVVKTRGEQLRSIRRRADGGDKESDQ